METWASFKILCQAFGENRNKLLFGLSRLLIWEGEEEVRGKGTLSLNPDPQQLSWPLTIFKKGPRVRFLTLRLCLVCGKSLSTFLVCRDPVSEDSEA